jgi:hypothetical protein
MGRRKLSAEIQKKTKVTRGKRTTAAQNIAFYGDEPIITAEQYDDAYDIQVNRYFNWANVTFENDLLKDFFKTYCDYNDFDFSEISSVPSFEFNTLGKIAYLINNDRPVSDALLEKFDDRILAIIDKIVPTDISDASEEFNEKLSADDKNKQEYWNLYSSIDQLIERKKVDEDAISKILLEKQPNLKVVKMIQEHYDELLDDFSNEFQSIPKTNRPYKMIIQKNLQDVTNVNLQIKSFVTNLENQKSSNRKPRKTRTRKEKPAGKLVEALKFKKNDTTLGLSSISPESIIGAKALVVFNTQTRKFGMFFAEDGKGLTVKGTTVLNFSDESSMCKTLRKPNEQISQLTESTLKRMQLLFKEIKAVETKLKGRINEDILLLKTYR